MLDLAKSLLAVEDAKLDADPWLLNVENGTINLRTGRREKHDDRDLLTKMARYVPTDKRNAPDSKNFCAESPGMTLPWEDLCRGHRLFADRSRL